MWWYRQDQGWRLVVAAVLLIVLLAMVSSMAGCAEFNAAKGTIDRYRAMAIDEAARTEDEWLESSLFAICRGASVGAIDRRFNTPELQEARARLCGQTWAVACKDVLERQRAACEELGP